MNKIEKLKRQQEGYDAAYKAIMATKPESLFFNFCEQSENSGYFELKPAADHIVLHIRKEGYINIPMYVIPELMTAFQSLLEDEDVN
jgi:hypothetical protein